MPQRIHKNSGHKKDRKHLPEEDRESEKPIADLEKNLHETNSSLALPDENIADKASKILAEDGYLVTKSEQVVGVRSKVHTDYQAPKIVDNSNEEEEEWDGGASGKKDYSSTSTSISALKKQLGFSWKSLSRRLAFFGLIFVIFGVVFISAIAALAINKWNETKPIDDLLNQRRENSVVYARDGKTKIFEVYKDEKREYVSIDNIPEQMQLAVIALEDENFYYNDVGIPWKNLVGAASTCILSVGDNCRGASGIAQQTVKLATDKNRPDDRTLDTKIDELFTAIKLSNSGKTKAQILELYLNFAPFGGVTYGVQSAAKTYFGKDVKDVTPVEACFLASLVQKPGSFSGSIGQPDSSNWKEFNARKNACLDYMHTKKLRGDGKDVFIATDEEVKALQDTPVLTPKTDVELAEARKTNAVVFVPNNVKDEFPHFREFVLEELKKFIPSEQDLYTKGYQIITTLDPVKQRDIEQILEDSEKDNVIANGGNNAAAVVLDGPTGEILSMVGSLGYDRTDIDGKVNIMTSPQQPGSSIKPYVYSTAFNKGFNPATIVIDTPTEFQPGYKPKNFDGTTMGPVSLRNAIQNSLNIPTIKTACLSSNNGKVDCNEGIKQVFDFAEQTGLRFACYPPEDNFSKKDAAGNYIKQCDDPDTAKEAYRDRCFLSSAVGGCEVIPLSHATGINTLLQDGNLRTATPFISIKDNTGRELYTPETKQAVYPSQDKAVDPLVARQIENVLSDYDARRPKFGASAKNLEVSECGSGAKIGGTAAKTGTTNDVKDTWTVGGCTNYTAVVWVGRTDNKPMKQNATSSTAAAPVWNKVMKYMERGLKPKAFSTDGLIKVNIDSSTGLLGGGNSELLTPVQKKVLEDAGTRISSPEYVPSSKNIFDYRSAVISQDVMINKLDGKLATSQTLPENIEKKTCLQLLPEFPEAKNWADPVYAIASKFTGTYCVPPTEKSDQDQVGEQSKPPVITSNLDSSTTNISTISINASPQGQAGKTITKIEVVVNGNTMTLPLPSPSGSTYSTSISSSDLGVTTNPNNIVIRATDNYGVSTEKSYPSVSFNLSSSQSFSLSDIGPLNCSGFANNSSGLCTFTISGNKTLPSGFRIRIGTASNDGGCSQTGSSVFCANLDTPPAGTNPVQAKINSFSQFQTVGNANIV